MRTIQGMVLLAVTAGLAAAQDAASASRKAAAKPRPIDFASVDRTIAKVPKVSPAARYGLFLFGINGEKRVFAILDKKDPEGSVYDLLWFDRDADGDLTEEGERFEPKPKEKETARAGSQAPPSTKFVIGDFTDPGTGAVHKDFELTWVKESVRFKMLWRGEKVTMGGYGPKKETYAKFAEAPAEAPVYVPGWDRPFEFEHWMSGTLKRGEPIDFKVFVGNRGDRTGTFSTVDDAFLPADESPVATLIYTDAAGTEQRTTWKLAKRC